MGPLDGIRVAEFSGIGPGPFCAQLLGDLGADVIRIERTTSSGDEVQARRVSGRSRRSLAIDLKQPAGVAVALELIERSDVLLEGFRPGVMERLGLGPDVCLERNPRLVYGRMTGWGQEGPLAAQAGHDINYISLTGALHAIGTDDAPVPPLNLVGDFGGGALYLALGVVAALVERATSGQGQVIDAAMVDGAASLMGPTFAMAALGQWTEARAANLLDGGAPFYGTYRCADGGHIAIGALEPQFYSELLAGLGLDAEPIPDRNDPRQWADLRDLIAATVATRTRDDWADVFVGTDACVTPVLTMSEATEHPHVVARETFIAVDGALEPAPAPRFSRTRPAPPASPPARGEHTDEILGELGHDQTHIAELRRKGAVR